MNTLDDLRSTLHAHLPTTDDGVRDRAASVRSRVQVVRRRRRMSVAVGAVAAIAVVAAGIALPRLVTDKGEPHLTASTTVTVGGFEYRLVRVVESEPGDTALDVTVPRKDFHRAIALLAEGLGRGSATLRDRIVDPEGDPWDGRPDDRIITDGANPAIPMPVYDDNASSLGYRVEVEGGTSRTRIGVAFYERTDRMPQGVLDSTGKTVFRQHVAGRTLGEARFLDGRAETSFTFRGALRDVRIAVYCGIPGGGSDRRGPFFFVSIDGDGYSGGPCGRPSEDAISGMSWRGDGDDRLHTVRLWTATEQGQQAAIVPEAVAGAAVYTGGETVELHGSTVDRVVEFAARLWQLDDVVESEPGARGVEASWPGLGERLLAGYAVEGTRRVRVEGSVEPGGHLDMTARNVSDTHSSSLSGVALPGDDEASYAISWPAKYRDASGAILVYRPLD